MFIDKTQEDPMEGTHFVITGSGKGKGIFTSWSVDTDRSFYPVTAMALTPGRERQLH